ncbi:MAG: death on curing protein [Candidatus Berkelbacteria bacterium Licking1014_85]|uniref:Death on curing protein n=1 Tax=Candidatus Berkelbacteria bacterium Licking1014_85 TaxID=2017148 RepID=A0A554LL89_9BACT|nr:MAG: death on curing protein [Candidatus Berkelbacteria bacterium Licking1014_85]
MSKFAKRISVSHIEIVAYQLAKATMSWSEPIPAFKTRFPNILESCVNTPFQTYNRKDLYPTIFNKSAMLFYLMVKNHPFQNGNKRIAVTTLLVFLFLNKYWLSVAPQKLYNLALWVAQSDAELRDATVAGLVEFIEKYSKKIH